MNEKQIEKKYWSSPSGPLEVIKELNKEVERLKRFAKNVNTYREKIYPDMIHMSEDKK